MKWIFFLALLASSTITFAESGSAQTADATKSSVLVTTIKLSPGSLPATVSAYGSIVPGPDADITITLQASGIVSSIAAVPGQQVAAGDILARVAPDAQSVADLQKVTGALQSAKENQAHVAALLASHLATNADLAAASQTVADAAGALAALQATGAGRARLIKAPFAGVVSAVLVAPGTAQVAGAALVRITSNKGLAAMAGLPSAQAGGVSPGDSASLSRLNGGAPVSGHVAQVTNMLDPQTGLREIAITLDDPSSVILNEPVQAVITTGTLSGYVVPRDSIQNDETGDYAFQIDGQNIAHRVAAHVLGNAGSQTVIAPDLNAAMPLVTTGAYQLADGMAVRMSP